MSIFGNIFGDGGAGGGLGYPIINIGDITVNTDFPLLSQVQPGWLYNILANVTDNAGAPYTNTGLPFYQDDKIYWTGSTWTLADSERIWLNDGVTITKVDGNDITDLSGAAVLTSLVKAKDANGLKLFDKDNVGGIFVEDGGFVGVGTNDPETKLHVKSSSGSCKISVDAASGSSELIYRLAGVDQFYAYRFFNAGLGVDVYQIESNSALGYVFLESGQSSIGTSTPKLTFEVNGSVGKKIQTVNSASATLDDTAEFISVTYTATGAVILTLPSGAAVWNSGDSIGITYIIADNGANAGTNNITINRDGSDTIITTTTGNTSVGITTDGGVIMIQLINATTWKVFGGIL